MVGTSVAEPGLHTMKGLDVGGGGGQPLSQTMTAPLFIVYNPARYASGTWGTSIGTP